MSLSFDGVNDKVSKTSVTLGSSRSLCAWIYPNSQSSGNNGSVCSMVNLQHKFRFNGSAGSKKMEFRSDRSTDGVWAMTSGFTTLTEWHFCAVTYDGSSTSNDPIMYVTDALVLSKLTVGSGLTETSSPSGSETNDGGTLDVGVNNNGNDPWDGLIAEFACWSNTILSDNEIAAIYHLGPMAVPGMTLYWPMDNTGTAQATDYSGNGRDGTISGAVLGANPPTQPAGRKG